MADQSAISVTGVGPRHAFIFNGTGGDDPCVVDQIVGTGIAASRVASGKYVVTHNLGKTGYCVQLTAEETYNTEGYVQVFGRNGNTFGVECWTATDTALNPNFVHGIIYD